MIRRLFFFDVFTLAPVLFFASFGEALQWVAITFGVGLVIVLLSIGQVRSLFRSMTEKNIAPNMQSLPAILGPGLAGLLLILPGLLTDLLAGIALLISLASLLKGTTQGHKSQQSGSRASTAEKKEQRVIVVDYETIDEEHTEKKTKDN